MLDFFEILTALKAAALPSGLEARQAEVIKKYASPLCDEIYTDRIGNLVCRKRGEGKKLMIPAHMDVIGFMATGADERGFLRFAPVGGHRPYALPYTPIIFENGVPGYIACDGETPLSSLSDLPETDLYIDIGAKSREEALSLVQPGLCAVFAGAPERCADGTIMTPYADNLASCAALLCAMSEIRFSKNDLYFVFSVQEEVGCRGAKTAANAIRPDVGIALDLTLTGDSPAEKDKARMAVSLGRGAAIKIRDSSLICDRPVVELLRSCAESAGIAYQNEVLPAGGTDGSAMQRSPGGVLSGVVSIPGRNIHTPGEIICESDALSAARLIAAAAQTEI